MQVIKWERKSWGSRKKRSWNLELEKVMEGKAVWRKGSSYGDRKTEVNEKKTQWHGCIKRPLSVIRWCHWEKRAAIPNRSYQNLLFSVNSFKKRGQCLREGVGVKAWESLPRASQPWGDLGRKQGQTVSERGWVGVRDKHRRFTLSPDQSWGDRMGYLQVTIKSCLQTNINYKINSESHSSKS